MIRTAVAIARKDLAIEARVRDSVPATMLFSVAVFVLFHFGTGRDRLDGDLAAGVLWVTLLLATVLAVNRLFASEREGGAIDLILTAPIDRTAIFVAKASVLFLYLVALEVVAVPAFAVLLLGPSLLGALPELIAIVVLADLGLALVGALVAGLSSHARAREVLVPLLFLPLVVPVVIAAASATEPLFVGAQEASDLARWLGFLGLYDMVFLLLSVAVFDFLMED